MFVLVTVQDIILTTMSNLAYCYILLLELDKAELP